MEQQLKDFENWAFNNLSINLSAYKSKQLHRRILSIMNRAGYGDLRDYSSAILRDQGVKSQFLDYITINVTEFFRNKSMFDDLEKRIQTMLLPKSPKLRLWSAACSIGAEPYSLGIILDKNSKGNSHYILGTDIDDNILKRAKEGIYSANEVKNVDPKDKNTYFENKDGKYCLKETIKKRVTFKKHDLILDHFEKNFDLIVCRNVVIYFNNESKDQIYEKFYQSLVPGGLLFVGATETIYNYRELGFEKVSTFLYQKKE